MEPPPTVPTDVLRPRGFDALYGLELLEVGSDEVRARVAVRDEVRQPFGLVHGGVFASIAESVASVGTAVEVLERGLTAMGMSNNTTFLRSVTAGSVHAVGGRSTGAGRRGSGMSRSPTTTGALCASLTRDDRRPAAAASQPVASQPR